MDRKLFSKSDGTSIFEDLKEILSGVTNQVRLFFVKIFSDLRNWYEPLGEPVVVFLEGVKAVIAQGTITGNIFDAIVAATKFQFDDAFLAWLRENLPSIIEKWEGIPESIDNAEDAINEIIDAINGLPDSQTGNYYHGLAAYIIETRSAVIAKDAGSAPVTGRDADTLAQLSYNLYRQQV